MQDVPRLFTYEEASALLPVLRPILQSIQTEKRQLDDLHNELEKLTPAMRTNGHATQAAELELLITSLVESIQADINTIHDLGVEIKDLDMGLVDFPSLREGRVVYLCWKVDEPQIGFWHDLDTGLAGREPL